MQRDEKDIKEDDTSKYRDIELSKIRGRNIDRSGYRDIDKSKEERENRDFEISRYRRGESSLWKWKTNTKYGNK